MKIRKLRKTMLSKLCKENNPEACQDCFNIRCECSCHSQDDIEDNTYEMLKNEESFDD